MNGYHVPPPGYPYQSAHSYEHAQGAFKETVSGDFGYPSLSAQGLPRETHQQIMTGARSDWSGAAKFAVVVGGIVAVYLIYRMSEGAKPVAKRLGGVAEKILSARMGDFGGAPALAPKRVKMTATPLSAKVMKA